MLNGCDRVLTLPSGETCFYGAFSDISFALRTIELFRASSAVHVDGGFDKLHEAFARPPDTKPTSMQHAFALGHGSYPPDFDTAHLLQSFVSHQQLQNIAAHFSPPDDEAALLRVCVALQSLTNFAAHKTENCQEMVQFARYDFQHAINTLLPVQRDSFASLQALLCAATFTLYNGRVNTAHSLTSTAVSLALRLGLLTKGMAVINPQRSTDTVRTLSTLMSMDMLTSLILDLPPWLPGSAVDNAGILTLAQEFETDGDLRTAAMLRQVCLLVVPMTLRDRARSASANLPETEQEKVMENIRLLETAHTGFRGWKRDVSSLLTALGAREEKRM